MNIASVISRTKTFLRGLKKVLRFATIFSLAAAFLFSPLAPAFFARLHLQEIVGGVGTPTALAAAQGDGIIVYGKSGTAIPQYRLYASATNTWGAETPVGGATFSGTPRFIVVKASATRDEAVVGVLNDTGTLFVVRWNGVAWSQLGSDIATGISDAKVFDIAYANTSGDAIVVAGGALDPSYYVWNGAIWSGPTTITQATKTTGTIRWIELAARKTSGSDEIALAYADTSGDLNALIWSGSAWTEQTAAAGALSTGIENNAGATTMRAFDVEYESLSGDLVVTWGDNGTVDPRYVTRTAAGTWSGILTASTFVEIPSIMNIAAEPWGDRVAVGLQNDTTGNSNDGDCGIWNGTGWVNTVNCDISRDSQEAGDMVLGSGWVRSGVDTRAINFYSDVADLTLDYNYWVPGTGWTTIQAFTPSPNCIAANSDDNSFVVETNPFNDAEIMVVRQAGTEICTQKTTYAGANTFNFGNAGSGSSLATPSVSQYQPVGFVYFKFQPNNLAVSTVGTQATTLGSGDANQHIGGGATAAFALQMGLSASTVTNVKIAETGTVELADLTSLRLFHESVSSCVYNGTESNVVASPVGEAVTFNLGGVAVPISPNFLCLYLVFDIDGGATGTKGGQTIDVEISNPSTDVTIASGQNTDTAAKTIAGATTLLPKATSATFGSGLSDGARSGESVTISGFGFGAPPAGAGRENCAGAVDTGCVRFVVGGAATIANTDITAWSNTSITFTVAAGLASFGSSTPALEVVSGSQGTAPDLVYIVYPNVTGMAAVGTNAGREHAAGIDTEGILMLQGDHFGSTAGSSAFTGGFGSVAATIHATAEGSCTTGGWSAAGYSGNTVCLEVNPSILDSVSVGTITLTRNSDAKTDFIDFRVLPRITANTPASGVIGDTIQLVGNHFCQTGTCPLSPNRSTASDNVKFGAAQGTETDFVNQTGGAGTCNGAGAAWAHTEICVKVPAGTPVGSAPTAVTSNTYASNQKSFTVASTIPNDPTTLQQFKSDGLTEIAPVGSGTNGTTVVLEGDISASISITMKLEVEVKATSTAFDGTITASSTSFTGTSFANVQVTVPSLSNGVSYHWRARVKNVTTLETSNWVTFGGNSEGPPAAVDFYSDTSAPTITFTGADTCADAISGITDQGATITWSTSDNVNGTQARAQVIYSINADLSGFSQTTETAMEASPHVVNLLNLSASTVYYFKTRSRDAVFNQAERPSVSPFCSFTTSVSVTRIMKSVDYFVTQRDQITSAGTSSSTFPIFIAESAPTLRNGYLELRGIMIGSGGSSPTVGVRINSQTTVTVNLPNSSSPQPFKIRYNLPSLIAQTTCTLPVENQNAICLDGVNPNTIYLTLGGGFSKVSLLNAKLTLTYHYSP